MILFLEEVIGFDPDNKKRWESILIQLSHLWRMVLYPNIFFFCFTLMCIIFGPFLHKGANFFFSLEV